MYTVTKRELNQNTASVLARVTAADDVVVTERGVSRWRISAAEPAPLSGLAALERDGRYERPRATPTPWPAHPGGPEYTSAEADVLLDEIRGDH